MSFGSFGPYGGAPQSAFSSSSPPIQPPPYSSSTHRDPPPTNRWMHHEPPLIDRSSELVNMSVNALTARVVALEQQVAFLINRVNAMELKPVAELFKHLTD